MGKYANGVYLKKSGHLAVIFVDVRDERKVWCVDEGKTKRVRMGAAVFRVPIVLESNSSRMGWGPTNFLKTSEYLGGL